MSDTDGLTDAEVCRAWECAQEWDCAAYVYVLWDAAGHRQVQTCDEAIPGLAPALTVYPLWVYEQHEPGRARQAQEQAAEGAGGGESASPRPSSGAADPAPARGRGPRRCAPGPNHPA